MRKFRRSLRSEVTSDSLVDTSAEIEIRGFSGGSRNSPRTCEKSGTEGERGGRNFCIQSELRQPVESEVELGVEIAPCPLRPRAKVADVQECSHIRRELRRIADRAALFSLTGDYDAVMTLFRGSGSAGLRTLAHRHSGNSDAERRGNSASASLRAPAAGNERGESSKRAASWRGLLK